MKKMRLALIILLIINILGLICLVFIKPFETFTSSQYKNWKDFENKDLTPIYTDENKVDLSDVFNTIGENYEGELLVSTVTNKIKDLLDDGFKQLYTDTLYTDITSYFVQNKYNISNQVGITNSVRFDKFIQKIQIYQDDTIKCEKAEIVENSYIKGYDYDNFQIKLSYSNGQVLLLDVSFSKKDHIKTPLVVIE